jgi:hypothetical protein
MGYTYKITYIEFIESLGFNVEKSFKTTDDAYLLHVKILRSRNTVSNIEVHLL